jgi:hypothetical protein
MAVHFIDCFAPGVGLEAPARLAEALDRAGRRVESRRPLSVDARPPLQPREVLRWRVVQTPGPGGAVLLVDEQPAAQAWDLRLCRALSAVCGGFVVARDAYRNEDREALATFFAGRTVELAAWTQVGGDFHVGAPPISDLLAGRDIDEVYEERFSELCRVTDSGSLLDELMALEDWVVSPPAAEAFSPEGESPTSRVLLADVEPALWTERGLPLVPAGWRWRSLRTPKLGSAYVELAHEQTWDASLVTRLSEALSCAALGLEIPGGGGASRWAEAWRGTPEASGTAPGARPLFQILGRFAFLLGEGAGMLFGRGDEGWNQTLV